MIGAGAVAALTLARALNHSGSLAGLLILSGALAGLVVVAWLFYVMGWFGLVVWLLSCLAFVVAIGTVETRVTKQNPVALNKEGLPVAPT
jgi:type IV secretory pathway TrbD component